MENGAKISIPSIVALIVSISGLIIFWIPVIGFIMPIIAIILGFISLNTLKKNPELKGKSLALVSIILGFIGLIIPFVQLIGVLAMFNFYKPNTFVPQQTHANIVPVVYTNTSSPNIVMKIIGLDMPSDLLRSINISIVNNGTGGLEVKYIQLIITNGSNNVLCSATLDYWTTISINSYYEQFLWPSYNLQCIRNKGTYTLVAHLLNNRNETVASAEKTFIIIEKWRSS